MCAMEINDEKRREVATRMREIMRENPHGWLDVMVAQSVLDVMGEGMAIGETVADLIDRPTTTRNGKFKTKYGKKTPCCEICGYSINDKRWSYCPQCGAEVVE